MAEKHGISDKTLNHAKSALGVRSFRPLGQTKWYWELPIEAEFTEVSQDSRDGHVDDSRGSQENIVTSLQDEQQINP